MYRVELSYTRQTYIKNEWDEVTEYHEPHTITGLSRSPQRAWKHAEDQLDQTDQGIGLVYCRMYLNNQPIVLR